MIPIWVNLNTICDEKCIYLNQETEIEITFSAIYSMQLILGGNEGIQLNKYLPQSAV